MKAYTFIVLVNESEFNESKKSESTLDVCVCANVIVSVYGRISQKASTQRQDEIKIIINAQYHKVNLPLFNILESAK